MAGLSGKQHIVDIVAASEQLAPSVPPPPPPRKTTDCPLGHPNEPGSRFCSACGMSMNAQVPARADQQAARPRPASELSEQEKAERERQHAEAVAAAAAFERAPEEIVPSVDQAVLIHFLEDGLTFAGRVWYRGQELAIGPDHPRWPEVTGWIMLDKAQQFERWGKQYFDQGPWPFQRSYVDPSARYEELKAMGGDGKVAGPSEEELRRADAAERARNRGVPAPAMR